MRKARKHYTAEEKVATLRRHLMATSRSRSSATNRSLRVRYGTKRPLTLKQGGKVNTARPRQATLLTSAGTYHLR